MSMHVIVFDKKDKKNNPGHQPAIVPNALYFDLYKAIKDCETLNEYNKGNIYSVHTLLPFIKHPKLRK